MIEYLQRNSELVCGLIEKRQIIRFWYQGFIKNLQGFWVIEPHLVGRQGDSWFVWAWCLPSALHPAKEEAEGWRFFNVQFMTFLPNQVLGTFSCHRPDYDPMDSLMDEVMSYISLPVRDIRQ